MVGVAAVAPGYDLRSVRGAVRREGLDSPPRCLEAILA